MNDFLVEEMRGRLPEFVQSITTADQRAGRNMYICPLCGSGTGKGKGQKNGAFSIKDGRQWHCFACDQGGGIYDLIGAYYGLQDFKDQLDKAAEFFGYDTGGTDQGRGAAMKPKAKIAPAQPAKEEAQEIAPAQLEAIQKHIETCAARMDGSPGAQYMKERGFTDATIKAFSIGYDAACNGVVIPYPGKPYYITRIIGADGNGKYQKPKGLTEPLFMTGNPETGLFVCEGQLDALSLLQAGADAVAAIGGGGARKLENLDGVKRAAIIIDRDEAGEKTGERIKKVLHDQGITSITAKTPDGYKDSNDLLKADAGKLSELVAGWKKTLAEAPEQPAGKTDDEIIKEISRLLEERRGCDTFSQWRSAEQGIIDLVREAFSVGDQKDQKESKFDSRTASDYLSGGVFESDIAYFKEYKDRKTGFTELDKYLTLYPGLAALGGASSLGKTTFAVNLADRLLKRGETVLYFSLEQLPIEIITKSLARMLIEKDPLTPLTNTDIKNGATCDALEAVKKEYAELSQNYHIITGNFHTTAQDIKDHVEDFIKQHDGIKPIVIIDYLQLIAPPEGFRGGVREYTDENIKALKDMQKKNGLFVIMISNFNRSSNNEPVSYESFKETSMIEYTCDYIWGLQLAILDAENTDFYVTTGSRGGEKESTIDKRRRMIQEAQQKTPKEVELVSLKNRNGRQFFKVYFHYMPQYDLYVEESDFLPMGASDQDGFTPFDN